MEKSKDFRIFIATFNEDGTEMTCCDTIVCDDQDDFNETLKLILTNYETDKQFNSTGLVLKAQNQHYNLTKDSNGVVKNRVAA